VLWRINPACPTGRWAVVPDGILTAPVLLIVTLPDTVKLDNVPTDVILGCAAVVTVAAEPDTLPVIVFVTVNPVNVPTEVMLGCDALVTVAADPDTLPVIVLVTVNPVNVPTLVIFGCAAVCIVPVKGPFRATAATVPPLLMLPLIPIPPVTTSVPELAVVLGVFAVSVVAPLAVNVVNAALLLTVDPMLVLSIVPLLPGFIVTVCGLTFTVAPAPSMVTLLLNAPVVAVNGLPSSEITV
jgi:hypothetical protein